LNQPARRVARKNAGGARPAVFYRVDENITFYSGSGFFVLVS